MPIFVHHFLRAGTFFMRIFSRILEIVFFSWGQVWIEPMRVQELLKPNIELKHMNIYISYAYHFISLITTWPQDMTVKWHMNLKMFFHIDKNLRDSS